MRRTLFIIVVVLIAVAAVVIVVTRKSTKTFRPDVVESPIPAVAPPIIVIIDKGVVPPSGGYVHTFFDDDKGVLVSSIFTADEVREICSRDARVRESIDNIRSAMARIGEKAFPLVAEELARRRGYSSDYVATLRKAALNRWESDVVRHQLITPVGEKLIAKILYEAEQGRGLPITATEETEQDLLASAAVFFENGGTLNDLAARDRR